MRNTIYKSVILPAPAAELYDMYLDAEIHGAFTGAPAKVSDEPGSEFEAFGGLLKGTTLQAVKPRLIVQSWRSVNFADDDPDSTLVIAFTEEEDDEGRIDLVHLDVPDSDLQGVTGGWESRYFAPWLTYLQSRN
ncbi:MAG: SRPBCC domain-containing protein [Gammaproteobacteria bacterium]|nr:SRPBCC domain-containing protein [Gammaproteobacteria bacterium]